MNFTKKQRRRAAILRVARNLSPTWKAKAFRMFLYHGETDQRLLKALVDVALEGGANAEDVALQKYANALRAGRRVGVTTGQILAVSTDPDIDVRRVLEIEQSLSAVKIEPDAKE